MTRHAAVARRTTATATLIILVRLAAVGQRGRRWRQRGRRRRRRQRESGRPAGGAAYLTGVAFAVVRCIVVAVAVAVAVAVTITVLPPRPSAGRRERLARAAHGYFCVMGMFC